jgi:predicted dehydrogenase
MRNAVGLDNVRLHGYVDVFPAAATAFLNEFGGAYATADAHKVLADDAVDAVLISTHHDSHITLGLAAAHAGKHILMEKPMAMTVPQCEALVEAVEEAGVRLMTGFKLRFAPLIQETRRLVPEPFLLVGQMMCNRWDDTSWAADPITGGGNLLSQGCHTFDLICYLADAEPVEVFAVGGNYTHADKTYPDNMAGLIRFANGAAASIIQGDAADTHAVSKFFFEVFDNGTSVQLYDRLHRATVSGANVANPGERHAPDAADPEGLQQELAEFADCLESGAPWRIGADQFAGRRATALAHAFFAAIETGQPQALAL